MYAGKRIETYMNSGKVMILAWSTVELSLVTFLYDKVARAMIVIFAIVNHKICTSLFRTFVNGR